MSLVLVHPSTVSRLKLSATAVWSDWRWRRRCGVGCDNGEHRRHVRGEHRRALGDAARRCSRRRSTVACLGRVSVVMMAVAASAQPSSERAPIRAGTPVRNRSGPRGMPMRPVEQTSTSSGAQPRPLGDERAGLGGCGDAGGSPVAALAFPLLRTTAARRPPLLSRCARLDDDRCRAARLSVNVAAAVTVRRQPWRSARGQASPDALMPQAVPAATNPGARTSWVQPHERQARRLGRPRAMLAHWII